MRSRWRPRAEPDRPRAEHAALASDPPARLPAPWLVPPRALARPARALPSAGRQALRQRRPGGDVRHPRGARPRRTPHGSRPAPWRARANARLRPARVAAYPAWSGGCAFGPARPAPPPAIRRTLPPLLDPPLPPP